MSKLISSLVFLTLIPGAAVAQIIPDSSLGAENSVVESSGNRETINGGAIRDANLFHSFQEFNVEALRSAYFTNPDGIANIFSRVTGNNISDIQGVLGVLGNANLYLINPNGILFGENARLDVNGSFFATTADSVLFDNGFEFSAVNPDAPPLLTIDIPIGLKFRDNPGDIVNRSNANGIGLSVNEGENISLIGGNVSVGNGGRIFAPGGRIELGGLVETGIIKIADDSSLNFPNGIARGDISIMDGSILFVASGNGGSIEVNAKNFKLINGSALIGGIFIDQGSVEAQSGDIVINLTEDLVLDGLGSEGITFIANNNFGTGNAGSIDISARHITFNNGGNVGSISNGQGNIGKIELTATGNISFDGIKGAQNSGVFSVVNEQGTGDIGEIKLTAQNLSLTNGAQIQSLVAGEGDSGIINIDTSDSISVEGTGIRESDNETLSTFPSTIFSGVINGTGSSGSINLTSKNLSLSNSGQIRASTAGKGNAGNIEITANNISIDGQGNIERILSGIRSNVLGDAEGTGGRIKLTTDDLSIRNGGSISAGTNSQGDAGNIIIDAKNTVSITGGNKGFRSGILAQVLPEGVGNGGSIEIKTDQFSLTNGAILTTSSAGQGDAGNIFFLVTNTFVAANGSLINSNIGSPQGVPTAGKVGNIIVQAKEVSFTDGAQLQAGIFSGARGASGIVSVKAEDSISFTGENTGIFSNTEAGAVGNGSDIQLSASSIFLGDGAGLVAENSGEGNGGNIKINTANFSLDFSLVSTSNNGQGDGGDIDITTGSISAINQTFITAINLAQGNAGEIEIDAANFALVDHAILSTSSLGQGNAGNIMINATNTFIVDNQSVISSNIGSPSKIPAVGKVGSINIEARKIALSNRAQIQAGLFSGAIGEPGIISLTAIESISFTGTRTGIFSNNDPRSFGDASDTKVSAPEISLGDGALINASIGGDGQGGSVTLQTEQLTLNNGSQIISSTLGDSDAGSLIISATDSIELIGFREGSGRSGLNTTATMGRGKGGDIEVFTNKLIIRDGATISASNFPSIEGLREPGTGEAGSVRIEANNLTLENGGRINAATQAGNEGNINLKVAEDIILRDNSFISARALKEATGGNIDIDSRFIIAFPNQNNDIIASAEQGTGGKIDLTAEAIFGIEERPLNPRTNDINASSQFGLDGSINITRPDVDPTSGLLELTQEVVDPAKLIAQNVCTQTADSKFVDIGKGGLPQNPQDRLAEDFIEVGLVAPIITSSETTESTRARIEIKPKRTRKPPAQGWIFHDNGIVELVAYNPNQVGEQRTWDNHRGCQN